MDQQGSVKKGQDSGDGWGWEGDGDAWGYRGGRGQGLVRRGVAGRYLVCGLHGHGDDGLGDVDGLLREQRGFKRLLVQ